jgi:hypothetical protein
MIRVVLVRIELMNKGIQFGRAHSQFVRNRMQFSRTPIFIGHRRSPASPSQSNLPVSQAPKNKKQHRLPNSPAVRRTTKSRSPTTQHQIKPIPHSISNHPGTKDIKLLFPLKNSTSDRQVPDRKTQSKTKPQSPAKHQFHMSIPQVIA